MKILSRLFLTAFLGGIFALATQTGCNISLFSTGTSDAQAEPTRLFVLAAPSATSEAELPLFSFAKISIPAYLDVPQIVTREGDEIARSGKNLWGEPFARAVARILPLRTTVAAEKIFKETPPAGTLPSVCVAINRLDGTLNGSVEIVAHYWFQNEKGEPLRGNASSARLFRATVLVNPRGDYTGYVRAISTALDRLAEDIAAQIATLHPLAVPAKIVPVAEPPKE